MICPVNSTHAVPRLCVAVHRWAVVDAAFTRSATQPISRAPGELCCLAAQEPLRELQTEPVAVVYGFGSQLSVYTTRAARGTCRYPGWTAPADREPVALPDRVAAPDGVARAGCGRPSAGRTGWSGCRGTVLPATPPTGRGRHVTPRRWGCAPAGTAAPVVPVPPAVPARVLLSARRWWNGGSRRAAYGWPRPAVRPSPRRAVA